MMRKLMLAALLSVSCLTPFTCAADANADSVKATKQRPNILFLFADDLRADALGPYGNRQAITPNLDRLARDGMTFTRAHIMGGNSGAVCVPSRAMMLSGQSFFRVPLQLKDTVTWPIQLRKSGYATHFSGKWHNGPASAGANFPGAQHVFLGGMTNQFQFKAIHFSDQGKPSSPENIKRHTSEVFADEAIQFIQTKHEQPWAMYVAFTAPHDPREAPSAWHAKFRSEEMTVPPNFLPEHPFDNGELKIRDEQLEKWPRTKTAIQQHWADYLAIIGHLDEQIGRILETLTATGQADNTLVVFAADNGLAMGSHGLMGKQNLYEHSMRVPLIARGPGVAGGKTSDAMCYLLDLCPTFCELANTKPPAEIHGQSLLPVLRGEKPSHREALLFGYQDLQRAVTDGRWKAIWYKTNDRWQLFDLQTDPHEMHDLIDTPMAKMELPRLREKLVTLKMEFGDQ